MSLQLLSITDPRDNLEKARRIELVAFARKNGVANISEAMPAILIRRALRNLGLTRITIPQRVLGQPSVSAKAPSALTEDMATTGPTNTIDADEDLARQFAAEAPKNAHLMTYNQLRRAARDLKVKLGRTDNMATIKEKVAAAMNRGQPG